MTITEFLLARITEDVRTQLKSVAAVYARPPGLPAEMDDPMTITEFLLARIAEDEAAARLASPGPWEYRGVTWPYDPARVLAECAAKREIVELWEEEGVDAGYMVAIDQVVRTLAAIYREHANYRSEWAV